MLNALRSHDRILEWNCLACAAAFVKLARIWSLLPLTHINSIANCCMFSTLFYSEANVCLMIMGQAPAPTLPKIPYVQTKQALHGNITLAIHMNLLGRACMSNALLIIQFYAKLSAAHQQGCLAFSHSSLEVSLMRHAWNMKANQPAQQNLMRMAML